MAVVGGWHWDEESAIQVWVPVGRGELEVSVREVGEKGAGKETQEAKFLKFCNRKFVFLNITLCQLEILSFILDRAEVVLITSKHGK